MPQLSDRPITPAHHARLFELLRQQEHARATKARLAPRAAPGPATVAPLARLTGLSLMDGPEQHR